MSLPETELALGEKYTDRITGFVGVCTGITVYLNGCIQALLESPSSKADGSEMSRWIDEQRLVMHPAATAGGPMPTPPGLPH